MNDLDAIIRLLESIGISAELKGEKMYFRDIVKGKLFHVLDLYGGREGYYYNTCNLSTHNKIWIYLSSKRNEIKQLNLQAYKHSSYLRIDYVVITTSDKEYEIERFWSCEGFSYKSKYISRGYSGKKMITIYENGVVEANDGLLDVKTKYDAYSSNNDTNYNVINDIMSSKYFKEFLEYYSLFTVELMETYNNCFMDSSTLKRLK